MDSNLTSNLEFDQLVDNQEITISNLVTPSGLEQLAPGRPLMIGVSFNLGQSEVSGFLTISCARFGNSCTVIWNDDRDNHEIVCKTDSKTAHRIFFIYNSRLIDKKNSQSKQAQKPARDLSQHIEQEESKGPSTPKEAPQRPVPRAPAPTSLLGNSGRYLRPAGALAAYGIIGVALLFFGNPDLARLGSILNDPKSGAKEPESQIELYTPEATEQIIIDKPAGNEGQGASIIEEIPGEENSGDEEDLVDLELLKAFSSAGQGEGRVGKAVQNGRINELREATKNHHGISNLPDPDSWFGVSPSMKLKVPGGATYKDLSEISEFGLKP